MAVSWALAVLAGLRTRYPILSSKFTGGFPHPDTTTKCPLDDIRILPHWQSANTEIMTSQHAVPLQLGHSQQGDGGYGSAPYRSTAVPIEPWFHVSPSMAGPSLPRLFGVTHTEYPSVEPKTPWVASIQAGRDAVNGGLQEHQPPLRSVFDHIVEGRVTEASHKLLQLPHWLVDSVVRLGESGFRPRIHMPTANVI